MMKCLLFSVAMVCAGFFAIESKAQAPAIDWQASYGGTWYDFVTNISPTTDGGYILSATSSSDISGEKTVASYGSEDYWIIKIDAFGTIEWQKAYGGSGSDVAIHVEQTADGGYIIGGYSSSGIGGNKTVSTYGSNDCWIIKTNASGTIEWQKTLGGTGYEIFYAVHQTSDGGYIVGADSESGFSGNKTEASLGGKDYWIVKLDAVGNISWQNAIGGSGSDLFADINITSDGGFIIGGNSTSGITGDKTENSNGGNDFWVLKLSSTGNIQWQNTIGGSSDDALYYCFETGDGGYFIGGSSASEISGDKTEPQFGDIIGMPDMWVMKLNNSGLIEWQNTIGGNRGDVAYAGAEKSDGTFVIAGNSSTGINGDKTEPAFGAAGITDYWALHLDETGNILWQRTLGGEASEVLFCVVITPDGGCMLGGASWSG
ncbi:MAG TPA: hypothetical protein PKL06_06500, partial [Chitinophagales bacterium]|nr:hypothetical protein [Chitinophagales bacterium]